MDCFALSSSYFLKSPLFSCSTLKGLNLCFNIMNVKLCLLNQEINISVNISLIFFQKVTLFPPQNTFFTNNLQKQPNINNFSLKCMLQTTDASHLPLKFLQFGVVVVKYMGLRPMLFASLRVLCKTERTTHLQDFFVPQKSRCVVCGGFTPEPPCNGGQATLWHIPGGIWGGFPPFPFGKPPSYERKTSFLVRGASPPAGLRPGGQQVGLLGGVVTC